MTCLLPGQPSVDINGLFLLNDGYQTIAAMAEIKALLIDSPDMEVPSRDDHIAYQTLRHDSDQNKFRPSSVYQKIGVVERYAAKAVNRDPQIVLQQLTKVFGKAKSRTIQRWIRGHGNLGSRVIETLKEFRSAPDSYVLDNAYLLGPGPQKLKPDDACKALHLCKQCMEDGVTMTESLFKTQICSLLLIKTCWVKAMKKQFGAQAIDTPVAWRTDRPWSHYPSGGKSYLHRISTRLRCMCCTIGICYHQFNKL